MLIILNINTTSLLSLLQNADTLLEMTIYKITIKICPLLKHVLWFWVNRESNTEFFFILSRYVTNTFEAVGGRTAGMLWRFDDADARNTTMSRIWMMTACRIHWPSTATTHYGNQVSIAHISLKELLHWFYL